MVSLLFFSFFRSGRSDAKSEGAHRLYIFIYIHIYLYIYIYIQTRIDLFLDVCICIRLRLTHCFSFFFSLFFRSGRSDAKSKGAHCLYMYI